RVPSKNTSAPLGGLAPTPIWRWALAVTERVRARTKVTVVRLDFNCIVKVFGEQSYGKNGKCGAGARSTVHGWGTVLLTGSALVGGDTVTRRAQRSTEEHGGFWVRCL